MRYVVIFNKCNPYAPYVVVDTLTGRKIDSFYYRVTAEDLIQYLNTN